jgi:phosphohistidine phosphatase
LRDSAAARGEILKSLTILRHAKSGWDVQVERDFDRPINKRGARGAELIGQWLKRQKLPVDRIIASPAVRVTETLDIFQPAADSTRSSRTGIAASISPPPRR